MAEYIERDAVIQKAFSAGLCDAHGNMYGSGNIVLVDDILDIPIANDVAIVAHGRWIETEYCGPHHMMIVQCSHCKTESEGSLDDAFCPHCGAKMDMKA